MFISCDLSGVTSFLSLNLYLLSILWQPIIRKIRIGAKNVIEQNVLETKKSIRQGVFLSRFTLGTLIYNYLSMHAWKTM